MQKKFLLYLTGAAALLAATTLTQAQELYVNGGIGNADADVGAFNADDTYFRIGGGVAIGDITYIEAGYWDMGRARTRGFSVSADGLFTAVKMGVDIGNNMELYGRVGLYLWNVGGTIHDDGLDLFFGGGLGFDVGPGTLGVEVHILDLDRVDLTTLGVAYTLPIEF